MLNKVKLGILIGAILSVVRVFAPEVDIPEGLADALVLVIIFFAQFFIKETPATVAKLVIKK